MFIYCFCLFRNIDESVKLIIGPLGYPYTNVFGGGILSVLGVTLIYIHTVQKSSYCYEIHKSKVVKWKLPHVTILAKT